MNMHMTFAMYGWFPCIAQVTLVVSPCGSSENSTMLWAANGLNMSSAMTTFADGLDSVMARRPAPTWRLPSHSYTAPSPRGAPLWVRFMAGSFSNGDQDV